MSSVSLLDHFSALKDPRQSWKVVYPLPEIMLLVLCATMSGMEDFVEIRLWGRERMDFLRRFLPYKRGLPSHDTLNDVMNALDAELFKACFTAWVGGDRLRRADRPAGVAPLRAAGGRARGAERHAAVDRGAVRLRAAGVCRGGLLGSAEPRAGGDIAD
jgi:hypothetical protein